MVKNLVNPCSGVLLLYILKVGECSDNRQKLSFKVSTRGLLYSS